MQKSNDDREVGRITERGQERGAADALHGVRRGGCTSITSQSSEAGTTASALQEAVVPKRCPVPRRWSLGSLLAVVSNKLLSEQCFIRCLFRVITIEPQHGGERALLTFADPGAPPAWTGSSAPGAGGTSCTSSLKVLRESANGNNPFLLLVAFPSGLQIDVEGPETSENPTQS
ncbi:unnamed protein product [Boreogadus saida]